MSKTDRTAKLTIRCHAFTQDLYRGHHGLGVYAQNRLLRVATALDEPASTI